MRIKLRHPALWRAEKLTRLFNMQDLPIAALRPKNRSYFCDTGKNYKQFSRNMGDNNNCEEIRKARLFVSPAATLENDRSSPQPFQRKPPHRQALHGASRNCLRCRAISHRQTRPHCSTRASENV